MNLHSLSEQHLFETNIKHQTIFEIEYKYLQLKCFRFSKSACSYSILLLFFFPRLMIIVAGKAQSVCLSVFDICKEKNVQQAYNDSKSKFEVFHQYTLTANSQQGQIKRLNNNNNCKSNHFRFVFTVRRIANSKHIIVCSFMCSNGIYLWVFIFLPIDLKVHNTPYCKLFYFYSLFLKMQLPLFHQPTGNDFNSFSPFFPFNHSIALRPLIVSVLMLSYSFGTVFNLVFWC